MPIFNPSRFYPSHYSTDDVESQISQHPGTQGFQTPTQAQHSFDDTENQHLTQRSNLQSPHASSLYATGHVENQFGSTQSFEHYQNHELPNTLTQRHSGTSRPENRYFSQRSVEHHELNLESQYPSTQSLEHPGYVLSHIFTEQHRGPNDLEYQDIPPLRQGFISIANDLSHQLSNPQNFEQHPNLSLHSNDGIIERKHKRGTNIEETRSPNIEIQHMHFQKSHITDDIERQYSKVLAPKPGTIPLSAHTDIESGLAQTVDAYPSSTGISKLLTLLTPPFSFSDLLQSSVDSSGQGNGGDRKMWQCLPSSSLEDLERRKPGCYHWNTEESSVCSSCQEERLREERSKIEALKRALGFRV